MSYSRCIVAGNSANNARSRQWSDEARGWIASKLDASCGRQSRGVQRRNGTILGASEVYAGKELGIGGDCVSGMKLLARGLELGALGWNYYCKC